MKCWRLLNIQRTLECTIIYIFRLDSILIALYMDHLKCHHMLSFKACTVVHTFFLDNCSLFGLNTHQSIIAYEVLILCWECVCLCMEKYPTGVHFKLSHKSWRTKIIKNALLCIKVFLVTLSILVDSYFSALQLPIMMLIKFSR